MTDSPRSGDLRLSIPADAVYLGIAKDVAVRYAEYAGAASRAAQALGQDVERIAARAAGEIQFVMEARGTTLTVRATSASGSAEAACPLPE